MSWDTASCFKSMYVAYNDFQRQRNDQTVEDLQRQIDVILGVTSHGATLNEFPPNELIYTETLSALVSLVNEPNLKTSLYLKSLLALSHLANDNDTKLCLQSNFNLSSSLVAFITNHSAKTCNKQMILQAIMLLERMTYDKSCIVNNIFMSDLLKYLVKSIYVTSSEFCIPSLAVLANLCRNNLNVREFVQKMPDSKQFLKVLLSYLSNSNKTLSITGLSIMASLYLQESFGESMFYGQNLINMTKLAFKVLTSNDDISTRHYAVDLIIDFIKCEKTFKIINSSSMLEADILKIFSLLHSTDAATVIKILKLLIEFCQYPSLCQSVSKVFLSNMKFDVETQLLPDQEIIYPAQSLLYWILLNQTEDHVIQANILSIVLFKNLIIGVKKSETFSVIKGFIDHVMLILLSHIEIDITSASKIIKHKFKRVAVIFELVLCLFENNGVEEYLVKQVNFDAIGSMIDGVLIKFSDDLKFLRDSSFCWMEIASFIFNGLEVMDGLKNHFESGLVKYLTIVKSQKLIPFLCHGLMSDSKYQIKASLQIVGEGLKVNHLDIKTLADTIYLHNSSQHNDQINSIQHSDDLSAPQVHAMHDFSKTINKSSFQDDSAITKLTEKLKDLDTNNGIKVSEIMDFYEHKLSALLGRESHIQDLLDAKSSTLIKTERLLVQYRCRHAQADAECLKLRSMLHSSEKKCEEDLIKLNSFTENKYIMEEKMSSLHRKIEVLQSIATEHEQFKKDLEAKNLELDSLQKNLKTVLDEKNSLMSTNASIIENIELLDKKLENANKKMNELVEENQNCINLIQEKEKETKNLKKSLKETTGKVTSLETIVKEFEASIAEKENAISQLHVELEKQCQISAMIHNLTMGKMNVPNLTANTSK